MKKERLSLQQLRLKSFITNSEPVKKKTLIGGNPQTYEETVCYSQNGGCDEFTQFSYCATDCMCPKDIPTTP